MFDFLGVANHSSKSNIRPEFDFGTIPQYQKLAYSSKSKHDDWLSFFWLENKMSCNLSAVGNWNVFIYGYCFYTLGNDKKVIFPGPLEASTVLNLFLVNGDSFFSILKGSFAIILSNKETRELRIYSDPFNTKRVFYYQADSEVIFSSSLSALILYLKQNGESVSLDKLALFQYYAFDYCLGNRTFIKKVNTCISGGLYHLKEHNILEKRLFDPYSYFDDLKPSLSKNESLDALEDIFKYNLQLYTRGPLNTAIALTGGFDSRLILSLMGDAIREYQFYSYGVPTSWDLKIPEIIAGQLNLKYQPVLLDERFESEYNEIAALTIMLGDGFAETCRANYVYTYSNYLQDYDSVLTGLFGSELIKYPSSRGMIWDRNIIRILSADDLEKEASRIFEEQVIESPFPGTYLKEIREEFIESIIQDPYINSTRKRIERYFFFLLMEGIPRYFTKEISVERPFVTNFHPFLDLDFITVLMKSPFPWIYNWAEKKSLWNNYNIHLFYSELIRRNNPVVSKIMSTHGYKPSQLRSPILLPFYFNSFKRNKKAIKRDTYFKSEEFFTRFIEQPENMRFINCLIETMGFAERTDLILKSDKLSSLLFWAQLLI